MKDKILKYLAAIGETAIVKIVLRGYYIQWCYRAGKVLKEPSKHPLIPYPIKDYPFQPNEDVDKSLRKRLEVAEKVIDNILYVSHQDDQCDDKQLIIDTIKVEALKYLDLGIH